MTIRSRLLFLLLPTLILFILLIFLFFFFNWNSEITASFRSNLKSIVVTTADLINPDEIAWIDAHRNDPELKNSPVYQKTIKKFNDLKTQLPIESLYVVRIEPVKLGEKVLTSQPESPVNQVYTGENPEYAFRQVILIDTKSPSIYEDFSESDEYRTYTSQRPLVTPIYRAKALDQDFITGYAPIINSKDQTVALVGADVNMDLLHRLVQSAILVLIGSTIVTIALVASALFFIAHRITQPVNQLKDAALALAAGDYDEKITVQGPKEIAELSNAFNTMRECLLDHINRLRDNSLTREHLYGEQECAGLLQSRMVDGVMEKFHDPRLTLKHVKFSMKTADQAMGLTIDPIEHGVKISLFESIEEGFDGVWALLHGAEEVAGRSFTEINFQNKTIRASCLEMPAPLLWSTRQERFLSETTASHPFESGDYLFMFSQELSMTFHKRPSSYDWITKVMKQFSKESIELLSAMLTSEIHFWMKKQHIPYQMHIICIRLN